MAYMNNDFSKQGYYFVGLHSTLLPDELAI